MPLEHAPGRISLLFGVPLDFDDFAARAGVSDFLSKFDDPKTQWGTKYEPRIAAPLRGLRRFAADLGVLVHPRATLDSLREATACSDVVILFAHWKGSEVVYDDFVKPPDAAAFAERAAAADPSVLGRWLSARRRGTPLQILTDALNEGPDEADQVTPGVQFVLAANVTRRARRRDQLDRLFEGLIRPGNRLELYDGLHPKESVEAALWDGFSGTLDLTTCTSTILADHISARREARVRLVQFPEVQELLWHAWCVPLALRLYTEQPISWQEARSLATDMLSLAVAEEGAARPFHA